MDRADQIENADRNIGFLLHDAARLMRVSYDRRMRALGLTRSQWWVMTFLYFHQGASQTALSEELEIERATLGRLLDRLEQKGWIARRSDSRDRRVKRVYLTGAVEELMQTMRARAADVRAAALRGFSASELEVLKDMLMRLKKNITEASEYERQIADEPQPPRVVNG
ncbi:MAG: MarR family transcriptional regulator [Alphaproteobacteria bacterium]|nr:MarR family transcriptional regulator [Alphaproteobacteria bacterium]